VSKPILVFNVPAHGHVNPTLPVVRELSARGHRVIYYDAEEFRRKIDTAEVEFRPYPLDEFTADFAERAGSLPAVSAFLLEQCLRLVPFAVEEIRRESAGLILFDSIAIWGMQAARLCDVPSVASVCTPVYDGVRGAVSLRDSLYLLRGALPTLLPIVRRRRELVARFGSDVFPRRSIFPGLGDANLVYTTRAFQPESPLINDSFHFVGASIEDSTGDHEDLPDLDIDPDRAVVYLSLGTVYHRAPAFFRTAFAAFSDHPARFIASVGDDGNLDELGPVPHNFIVRPRVNQLGILRRADAFITHGGMNSISESLHFGVPMVVVPRQIEQALNGRRAAALNAGVLLGDRPPYGTVDDIQLRAALDQVLLHSEYTAAARHLAEASHRAGGYLQAASVIQSHLFRQPKGDGGR
jgi:MGT family glycosyltransferase